MTLGTMFSQGDLEKELRANKWYSDDSPKYTAINYYKTPQKGRVGTAHFLKSGKVIRCDSVENRSFTKEGNEVITPKTFGCDTAVYQLKKDKIHIIEDGSRHWYYKLTKRAGGFEFSPIYSDEFNKD